MRLTGAVVALMVLGLVVARAQEKGTAGASFKDDVFPVFRKYCLPCHSEDNFNPSELSLDSYDLMMQGGKHGTLIVRRAYAVEQEACDQRRKGKVLERIGAEDHHRVDKSGSKKQLR